MCPEKRKALKALIETEIRTSRTGTDGYQHSTLNILTFKFLHLLFRKAQHQNINGVSVQNSSVGRGEFNKKKVHSIRQLLIDMA